MLSKIGLLLIELKNRRDLSTIIIGRGLQALTLFVGLRLMTHVLAPAEIGRYYILISLTSFFALFLVGPMGSYITRKTNDWYNNSTLLNNLVTYFLYLLIVAFFAFIILLLIDTFIGFSIETTWYWLLIVITGSLLFNSANLIVTGTLNLLGNRLWFIIFSLLTLWIGLIFSFLLTLTISDQAEYWLTGIIIGQFAIFVVSWFYLKRKYDKSVSKPKIKKNVIPDIKSFSNAFHFTWPLSIVAGLSWLQTDSYRFILESSSGLEVLGLFAVGYGIATSIMSAFHDVMSLYLYPIFYREITSADLEGKKQAWNKLASFFIPAIVLMTSFIISCAPYLTKLMADANLQGSGQYVLWGALVQALFFTITCFRLIAHAGMKTTWLILPGITGAVAVLGGIFILKNWDPIIGTGISLLFGSILMVIHLAIRLHKEIAFSLPWKRILIATLLSIPLLTILFLPQVNISFEQPTYIQAIGVLVVGGGYLLLCQYFVGTRWLPSRKTEDGI
ncbi:MAG: oligosaccharide flippase family protein [Dehalococcoidales bacterium]|nr:oligosaccharide flippase family protein [Dehalococcoidales bacterium]